VKNIFHKKLPAVWQNKNAEYQTTTSLSKEQYKTRHTKSLGQKSQALSVSNIKSMPAFILLHYLQLKRREIKF